MQLQERRHVKSKENIKLLNSLIASMTVKANKPLAEHKPNSVQSSKLIKLSFNSEARNSFKPKAIKTYLKGEKSGSSINAGANLKSINASGAARKDLKIDTRNCKFDHSKKVCKSYRKANVVAAQKKDKPSKNLSINTSTIPSINPPHTNCLATGGVRLEPTNLGTGEPLRPGFAISFPNYEPAKCSLRSNCAVQAYAVNTNQGIVR